MKQRWKQKKKGEREKESMDVSIFLYFLPSQFKERERYIANEPYRQTERERPGGLR